jgi:hypothetical protein
MLKSAKEGQTGIIRVDNEDPAVLIAMLEYLYTSAYSVTDPNVSMKKNQHLLGTLHHS